MKDRKKKPGLVVEKTETHDKNGDKTNEIVRNSNIIYDEIGRVCLVDHEKKNKK